MPDFSQENRPLRVTLGDVDPNAVFITAFSGTETISRLFSFSLTLAAPVETPIAFADVLGKPAVIQLDQGILGGETRHVHGIVSRFAQGAKDSRYIWYRAEVVPQLWLLTRFTRSRIFQQKTVKEILTEVLADLYSPRFDLTSTYPPRNYCVQYRESDFAFVSRLMEEEGMYYYFTHTEDATELVIADHAEAHDPVADPMPLVFQDENNAVPSEGRIVRWDKAQELRAGKLSITDKHFEMPPQDFESTATSADTVKAGTVEHALVPPAAAKMTIVEHPAGFGHYRDGVDQGGADRAADIDPLFDESTRMGSVQLDQQMAGTIEVEGDGSYCRLIPGHKFTLAEHFDADGDYVLTSVRHAAACGAPDSGSQGDFQYTNRFTCIPAALAFRPQRTTPWPFIRGTQTGTVVGDDKDVDPDKHGRIKVHFHWDREGQRGLDTSCWVRVAQFWAGRQWGAQFIPRIGDEVVVAFEDGDPDRPLVIGSVYNADNVPIYKLPDNKTQSGIKTTSIPGGGANNYNQITFEDKKGGEFVSIHGEKDMMVTVEDNYTVSIGAEQKDPKKAGKSSSTTYGDTSYEVSKGDYKFSITAGKADYYVKGPVVEVFDDTQSTTVTNSIDISSKADFIHVSSPTEILLTVGDKRIQITPSKIILTASEIHFEGKSKITGHAPDIGLAGDTKVEVTAPTVSVVGDTEVTIEAPTLITDGKTEAKHHGAQITVAGDAKAVMMVGASSVAADPATVKVAAPTINLN